MTEVRLWYGDDDITATLPDGVAVTSAANRPVAPAHDPLSIVANAIDDSANGPPLVEAAQGTRNVAIVVPDRTRPASTHQTLLPIISRLARAGVSADRMRVVIARGIHPAAPRHEIEALMGGAASGRVQR